MMKKHLLLLLLVLLTSHHVFPQETNQRIDSLQTVLSEVDANKKTDVLNQLSKEWIAIAPNKALEYATEAQVLAQSEAYEEGEALAVKNIGYAYLYTGKLDTALYFYRLALNKYTNMDDLEGIASSIANIGSIHSINCKYELALENYLKALRFFETLKKRKEIANTTRLIGIVYGGLYDYPSALSYFRKSSELAMEIGDDNILAYSYNNIAIIYGELHDYDNASSYYLKAIDVFEKIPNSRGANSAKANLATIYANLDDYDNAIPLLKDCINFSKEVGNMPYYAISLSNCGMMYNENGNHIKAIEYIQQAIQIHRELNFKAELSRDLLSLGVIYMEINDLDKATEYFQEALPISLESNDYWGIAICYEKLSEINITKGDLPKALKNYKLYKVYNDSTLTKENQDKLAEMDVKYHTEQKETENQLLQQEVRINEITINQKNRLILIFIIVIAVIVLLMAVIYYFFQQKSIAYDILVRENLKSLEIEKKIEKCITDTPLQASLGSDDDSQNNLLRQKLEKFMIEEKPYLWVDVNMEEFCVKLNTNRTYLSKLINNYYNQSFKELLFEYRIRAARELLSDPSKTHLSIEGIGELAGFKTNTTFHKKFKSVLNLTPQQFRAKALKRIA